MFRLTNAGTRADALVLIKTHKQAQTKLPEQQGLRDEYLLSMTCESLLWIFCFTVIVYIQNKYVYIIKTPFVTRKTMALIYCLSLRSLFLYNNELLFMLSVDWKRRETVSHRQ